MSTVHINRVMRVYTQSTIQVIGFFHPLRGFIFLYSTRTYVEGLAPTEPYLIFKAKRKRIRVILESKGLEIKKRQRKKQKANREQEPDWLRLKII